MKQPNRNNLQPRAGKRPVTVLTGDGRTFVLITAFIASTLAGIWLGAVAAFVSGTLPVGPSRFPGEDLAAAFAATFTTAAAYTVVRRTKGRLAAFQILFVAACAAANFLHSLHFFAPPGIPFFSPKIAAGMLPTLLVAFLLCRAEIKRSALLRSVGSVMGAVFAFAGFVLSLASAFT